MTDINIEIIYKIFFFFLPYANVEFIVGEIERKRERERGNFFSPRTDRSWVVAGETRWIGSFPIGSSMSPGLMFERVF